MRGHSWRRTQHRAWRGVLAVWASPFALLKWWEERDERRRQKEWREVRVACNLWNAAIKEQQEMLRQVSDELSKRIDELCVAAEYPPLTTVTPDEEDRILYGDPLATDRPRGVLIAPHAHRGHAL